ncbi:MAG: GIY-YIG nuclease family protein [Patescibacteria group bacterium]
MRTAVLNRIKAAPKDPGVYIFHGDAGVLYVGKAVNLKNRLRSYLKITDAKTESLNQEAVRLDYIVLRSEIESLIEESRLIKELKPKYNILWQDDKSYLYVALTRQSYPKIFITHKNSKPRKVPRGPRGPFAGLKISLIGPFTDGAALRLVLRLLRRQYPYCTCAQTHLRDCLNAQIEKCLGFCCKRDADMRIHVDDANNYRKNIRMIKSILLGQSKKLISALSDPQERAALEKIFEHKDFINQQIANPVRINESRIRVFENSKKIRYSLIENIQRVECYDNSHLSGKEAVGAMTVLVKKDGYWQSDKSGYRKFKIKSAQTQDDPRMIAEVLERRLNHPEWPYPDLIIIDGGLAQYNAAKKILEKHRTIQLISFAKPNKQIIGLDNSPPELQKLAEQAIYQTHNFAIRYHRQVRRKEFLR